MHKHTHAHTHAHMHACTCTYLHTCTYMHTPTCMHMQSPSVLWLSVFKLSTRYLWIPVTKALDRTAKSEASACFRGGLWAVWGVQWWWKWQSYHLQPEKPGHAALCLHLWCSPQHANQEHAPLPSSHYGVSELSLVPLFHHGLNEPSIFYCSFAV